MSSPRMLVLWLALLAAPGLVHAQDLDDLDDLAGDEESDGEGPGSEVDSDEDGDVDGEAPDADLDDEGAASAGELETVEDLEGNAESDAERGLAIRVGGGLGGGTLSYKRTRGFTRDVLETSPMAVAEALIGLRLWPQDALSLGIDIAYQTSVGFRLGLEPQFGLPEQLDARYQRGQLHVVPVVRLGDGPVALGVPIGFGFQALTTEVHQYDVPGFVLAGAALGVDVHVQVGDWLSLTVGPTSEWLFILGSELPDQGVCCQGVSLGGRASFDLHVSRALRASFAYQETHTSVPTFDDAFQSVARMLTARLLGEM